MTFGHGDDGINWVGSHYTGHEPNLVGTFSACDGGSTIAMLDEGWPGLCGS